MSISAHRDIHLKTERAVGFIKPNIKAEVRMIGLKKKIKWPTEVIICVFNHVLVILIPSNNALFIRRSYPVREAELSDGFPGYEVL